MNRKATNRGISEELVVRIFIDLYRHGKQTAKQLAARYDVCERTIRRKLDVLSVTVPVCEESGRNGGFSLMEGYEIRRARQ